MQLACNNGIISVILLLFILSHLEVCVDLGITREELAAALNTTVLLCGGPGYAYSAFAMRSFEQMLEARK